MFRFAVVIAAGIFLAAGVEAQHTALYAAVGAELIHYGVDVPNGALDRRDAVTLPESVQYAWPHPSGRYLYVGWSNGAGANHHGLSAFQIDSASGGLRLVSTLPLNARPIHVTVDIPGTHVLVGYNDPSGLSVHRISPDGKIGPEIPEPGLTDRGIYAHQIRVHPSNDMAILVTRGNGPAGGKAEDPGALKILGYHDGLVKSQVSIAPGGGFGFQPRHLDFSGPWVFVSLERQNKLQVYRRNDNTLSKEPLFTKDSLGEPRDSGQAAGTVHVHPNGKYLYQANRGRQNSIAVWSINQNTGEPTLIQNIDTRGSTPRTFALDPSARILVAANQNPPAGLAVFRIREDGKLDFVRKYDVPADAMHNLFWMGLVAVR